MHVSIYMRKNKKTWLDTFPIAVVKWIGSWNSLIVHTIMFVVNFSLYLFGVPFDTVLLILTTVVSIEAIYLAIFMQISINQQTDKIEEVERLELAHAKNKKFWQFW